MLVAVLSDIHANLEALHVALSLAEQRGADRLVCLGDVVGYGPDPGPCVDIVREQFEVCVLGNHDAAVAHDAGTLALPRDGQAAARLHRELLSPDQLAWLGALPLQAEIDGATLVHAGPDEPETWPRLDGFAAIRSQFAAFDTPMCFVGHSHKPAVVSETLGVLRVRPGHRFLVDVGSVGQPRDHDPRLSFVLFDTEAFTVEHVRAHYDHAKTAQRIEEVGLPRGLGERLRKGV